MSYGEIGCLVDSATMHTTLHEREYITKFIPKLTHMTTILGPSNLIEGHGTALLSIGIEFTIKGTLYSLHFGRILLSIKDT